MLDEVAVTHRHADDEQRMEHVDEERIDGLHLRQFTCACGFSAALLTRVAEAAPGRWPSGVEAAPRLS